MFQFGAAWPLCPPVTVTGVKRSYAWWFFRRTKGMAEPSEMRLDKGQNLFPLCPAGQGILEARQCLGAAGQLETGLGRRKARARRNMAHLDRGLRRAGFRMQRLCKRWNNQAYRQNHENEKPQDHAAANSRPATGPATHKSVIFCNKISAQALALCHRS